jgi:hypothetical protein
MRRVPIIAFIALIYLVAATSVFASAYSLRTYKLSVQIPGYSGWTDACLLSGIETGGVNTGVITSYFSNTPRCQASDQRPLATGYLGVFLWGYRGGSLCGTVGFIDSNTTTHYWQYWSTLCSNPAGSQEFKTLTSGQIWNGNGYAGMGSQWSPGQNY